jgi:hypothetical protein
MSITKITSYSIERVRSLQKARNVGAALDAIAKATGGPRLQLSSPIGQALVRKLAAGLLAKKG